MSVKHQILNINSAQLCAAKTRLSFAPAQVCLAIPWTDKAQIEKALSVLEGRAGFPAQFVLIEDVSGMGPAGLINAAFRQTDSAIFGYLAQDVFPSRDWLAQALNTMKGSKKAGLFAFNDGKWAGALASFGLADRRWISSVYGGQSLFYSQYHQHYGDTELTLIAREQGVYIYNPDCVMMEIDERKESKKVNAKDRQLFGQRKLGGFDGRVSRIDLLGLFG